MLYGIAERSSQRDARNTKIVNYIIITSTTRGLRGSNWTIIIRLL